MVEDCTKMDGIGQQITRPIKQQQNSPTLQAGKLVTKGKSGQPKAQKFNKANTTGIQQYPSKNKAGRNYSQKRDYVTNKTPSLRGGYKQRFEQLSLEDKDSEFDDYDYPVMSRKDQNSLNHLLNFTFAPRTQTHHVVPSRKKGAVRRSCYNKEQFLQANCQFVVQDGNDYSINNIDPDSTVDWELIEQVRVRCIDVPSCPICLYHPVAAQITRCGHIYCWSCILHYLSLSETKSWRKCPICYESIHKNDLKSVVAVSKNKNVVNQEITMSLMKRSKSSVFALPIAKWVERDCLPELTTDEEEMHFAKFLQASPQAILSKIMVKIRSELDSQLMETDNDQSEEKIFVELAIDEFHKREERLLEMCGNDETKVFEIKDKAGQQPSSDGFSKTGILPDDEQCSVGASSCNSVSSEDSHTSHKSTESSQFYYFYQADDGQQIFLHPVNVRCLIKEYGSLEFCPETLTGRIVEMEYFVQSEQIRRRFGYLRHLPLTCDFAMCEIELKPPAISRQTLNFFKDDLRKRCSRRQKKAKEQAKHDDKCRSKFSLYEGVQQPRNVEETPDLTSEHDFPQQVSNIGQDTVWVTSSPPKTTPWSTNPSISEDAVSSQSGQSFAEALSTGNSSNQVWRKPKPRVDGANQVIAEKQGEESDGSDEGEAVPTFKAAFTDALFFSDWNLNVEETDTKESDGNARKRKNKKKNKKLLFSTGSAMKL